MPYVSRGGLKLAKALKVFALDLTGKPYLTLAHQLAALPMLLYKMVPDELCLGCRL